MGLALDKRNNVFICGYFKDTATFGTEKYIAEGETDAFIAKYDSTGSLQWARQAGGPGADFAHSVALATDGSVYIAGMFEKGASVGKDSSNSKKNQTSFLIKYDSIGNLAWARQLGSGVFNMASNVTLDKDDNAYITGYISEISPNDTTILGYFGDNSAFLAKYSPAGNLLWKQKLQGSSFGSSLATDENNSIYWTGMFEVETQFGNTKLISHGYHDGFVAKSDSNGRFLWALRMGGKIEDAFNSVATDKTGNVFVSGNFTDSEANFGEANLRAEEQKMKITVNTEGFITKLNANGKVQWIQQRVPYQQMAGRSLRRDAENNLYLITTLGYKTKIGEKTLVSRGANDVVITKLDSGGKLLWIKQIGGPDNESAGMADISPNGEIYVTGSFQGTTTLAGRTLTAKGKSDIFVVKYKNE